ncbi:hypothetical protein C2G38_2243155 [Gigaspora rosea]|uniref:Uncharacterized protein n=1 Tax=Gigaspora rosea TaxID=44941 RepID=A0A397VUJ2_9GLOM|nr:hypothetical protein C2G38_2243155 [Gigaspora rosea]
MNPRKVSNDGVGQQVFTKTFIDFGAQVDLFEKTYINFVNIPFFINKKQLSNMRLLQLSNNKVIYDDKNRKQLAIALSY